MPRATSQLGASELPNNRAVSQDYFHGVVVRVHGFGAVGNDHVTTLAGHFDDRSKSNVFGF